MNADLKGMWNYYFKNSKCPKCNGIIKTSSGKLLTHRESRIFVEWALKNGYKFLGDTPKYETLNFNTMNEKQLPLVTFEQAKRLKEAGFDWDVCRYDEVYNQQGVLCDVEEDGAMWDNFNEEEYYSGYYSAPTVALALKWFREVKKIPCAVRAWSNLKYGWEYCYKYNHWHCSMHDEYDTHCNAESALLDEILTLIEKEK